MIAPVTHSELVPESLIRLVMGHLHEISDFLESGILLRNIIPPLTDGQVPAAPIRRLADYYRGRVGTVVGLESCGFILVVPLAARLGVGMVTMRKGGKLPGSVIGMDYALEYGTARMELRPETVTRGVRVLVIDGVLAIGEAAAASTSLIEQVGATVGAIYMLLGLSNLGGRRQLQGREVNSIVIS